MITGLGKKLAVGVVLMVGLVVVAPVGAHAAVVADADPDCEVSFFGMRPWYAGLVVRDNNDRCVVGEPDEDTLPAFVWTVILNVLFDLFVVLGFASLIFVVLGGYWYLRSGGDPSLVERGKKTIQAALVGTVIALSATMVTNLIITILTS